MNTAFAAVRFERLPLARLQPAPYNPRVPLRPGTPAYRKLERSLREFGLVQPIVWNERTGHVVSGHQRLEILKQQGATDVHCAVVSLSPERERALNITLNNALVGSEWDAGKLVQLVAELAELPDFDATLTGFDPEELRDLVLAPAFDFRPEAPAVDKDDPAVRVTLEIPADDWEAFRPELDELIAARKWTVHIRLPQEQASGR